MAKPERPLPDSSALLAAAPEGVGEGAWIDVIQKMDEVYSDLLQYEVALEEKNAKLEESQGFILSVLTSISDILVVCDRSGRIDDVNRSLEVFTGRSVESLRGTLFFDLLADPCIVSRLKTEGIALGEMID